ncbi:BGTF surface domain-containing protein [Haloarcula marina]|uniref:BGTF surface domain-containing protein n=1 Tax=Haloarcula marina TaxID=2961574 RepID=UPI0020B80546|nr:BGTF surface domain-containing protein [Halomicroarcula marina]
MNVSRTAAVGASIAVALVAVGAAFALPALSGQPSGPADATTADRPDEVNGTVLHPVNDSLRLETRANATVEGTTNLSAGSTVTVRIASENTSTAFLVQRQTTVGEDGTFAATADLSHVTANGTATVSVRHDGAELTNRTARVVAVPGASDSASTPTAGSHLAYDGQRLTVAQATGQEIRGTTDRDPGTTLTVRARSTGSSTPFLRQRQATVGEDGTFVVTMDFESVPSGTRFTVSVHHDGETLTEADAVVAN